MDTTYPILSQGCDAEVDPAYPQSYFKLENLPSEYEPVWRRRNDSHQKVFGEVRRMCQSRRFGCKEGCEEDDPRMGGVERMSLVRNVRTHLYIVVLNHG